VRVYSGDGGVTATNGRCSVADSDLFMMMLFSVQLYY